MLWGAREAPSVLPVSLAGRRHPSKERNWEKKGWSRKPREGGGRREGLILRKKKRKGRAKLDSDWTRTACQVWGAACSPPGFQEGLPRALWSLAHRFSELLCHWREVREGMNGSIRGAGSAYLAAGLHQRPGWGMGAWHQSLGRAEEVLSAGWHPPKLGEGRLR